MYICIYFKQRYRISCPGAWYIRSYIRECFAITQPRTLSNIFLHLSHLLHVIEYDIVQAVNFQLQVRVLRSAEWNGKKRLDLS